MGSRHQARGAISASAFGGHGGRGPGRLILSLLFCLINSSAAAYVHNIALRHPHFAAAYVHNIALRHPHFLRAGRCCLTEDDEESVEVTAEVVPDEVDAAEVVEQMRILSEADEEEQLLLRSLMKKKMAGMSDAELKRIADDLDGGGGDLIEKINALQGTKAGELYESLVDEQDGEDAEPEDPRNGQAGWGRWSHNDEGLSLELFVPEETGAKDITCEVQVGFLDVRVKDEPLLSGRLAAEVKRLDLEWALDDDKDSFGKPRRVLCIDLPWKEPQFGGPLSDTPRTALFESLRVDGAETGQPGLVSGYYLQDEGWLA